MKRDTPKINLSEIRQVVADYIGSEGCSCCEGTDHKDDKARLAKLLKVRKYSDKSGYNFHRYASK